MEVQEPMDVMMVVEESATETNLVPGTECNAENTSLSLETGQNVAANQKDECAKVEHSELEPDYELICIDFFLRYISNLYPLWGEYGDNLMFHIAQIYGAISKEEFSPYLKIIESVGLKINEKMKPDNNLTMPSEIVRKMRSSNAVNDLQGYPLDIDKCDPQVCIRAISHLDSYREWLDGMLTGTDCGLESVSQISECLEGQIGKPINEWKPANLSGELVLPLVYQAYVTMEVRRGGDFTQNSRHIEERASVSEKTVILNSGGKPCISNNSPSKGGNEVGVTYEKNRDRWVAVWTENGIRRSRIFNVKQYGYDTAREMAIQYRREQLANINNKIQTGTPVQTTRTNKRSRRSIEGTSRSGRTSPSVYNTRNSNIDTINLQNPDYEVFYDQERDSWICKNSVNTLEQETLFSVEEFGTEKAKQLAIEKAGGLADETSFTPVKKASSRASASKGAVFTPKRRDSQGTDGNSSNASEGQPPPSSSFRIRIATNVSGSKAEPGTVQLSNGTQNFSSEHNAGGRSESRKSASGEEFLVYHGKKYYFGPVIEGIRYDKIQNRWVTGYVGQDGRKRYKYFSIGAYGFEGSRQLAIEYRESMYSSTKGVERLSEFLQTVIQGFPAYENGVLQDVSFEDLTVHKGQLKDGSERYYFCIPSKGDFLVTTPTDREDEQVNSLLNRYRSVLQNSGGKEEHLLKESVLACSRSDSKSPSALIHSNSESITQKEKNSSISTEVRNEVEATAKLEDLEMQDIEKKKDYDRPDKILVSSVNETLEQEARQELAQELKEEIDHKIYESSPLKTNPAVELDFPKSIQGHLDSLSKIETPSSRSSASVHDCNLTIYNDSMYIDIEDKSSPDGRKRFFIGPQIDGVSYNPMIHRWVTQYDVDGVSMTKNFSVKSYGFEKSRYLAIQWRIKYNGEPPQLNQLIQALQDQGIEYPPK
ncbi:AP2 domain-containing [Cryptosporidium sp. chipmunk genotype I]|uniref:AP2 domain-containing n=1 Tax=Cryptosporidium sp. chipmunk genotype I TaxID=1280935 RepID=UPI00351AA419|nr:AP2 domain-containing [Cryptosporidium sp. chipmunk genotype I]